jgi:hypothetical protein
MLLSMVLGTLLIVTGIGWIVTAYKLSSTNKQFLNYQIPNREAAANARELTIRVAALEQEVSSLQEEKASLIQSRIPDLNPLAYDSILPISLRYFKNIIFTRTGTENAKIFEYRAVLQNDGQQSITPDVSIILFDSLGVQVGMTRLAKDHVTSDVKHNGLKPGESRVYSSQIKLSRASDPEYFLVEVQ